MHTHMHAPWGPSLHPAHLCVSSSPYLLFLPLLTTSHSPAALSPFPPPRAASGPKRTGKFEALSTGLAHGAPSASRHFSLLCHLMNSSSFQPQLPPLRGSPIPNSLRAAPTLTHRPSREVQREVGKASSSLHVPGYIPSPFLASAFLPVKGPP